ncbi:choice-of-anchor D domain-containing protein, partial [candidate division NPL-UPA2 bacterium]|nr:choice-of-anchor D domain-containing protein [candidate division NPL-UPA2 bacterium]
NLTGLTPGTTYNFRASARNSAGWGIGNTLHFTTVTPPSITIDPVTTPTNVTTQTITGTMESGATVTLSSTTTGTTFGAVTTPTATTWSVVANLVEGSNNITATATDAAGNIGTATTTIVLDTTAPTITIDPVTTPTNITTQAISGTMEAGATVALTSTTTGVTFTGFTQDTTAGTWSATINLVEGNNNITATATDAAQNTGTATANIILEIAPVLSVTPDLLDFGNVLVGKSRDLDFTVTNTGGGTLRGEATLPAGPFRIISGSPFNIPAGQNATVTVRFSPTATGPASETVTFTSNGGNLTRDISGMGVPLDDTDGDGLPDAWELEHFGHLNYGPDDDPDNDGYTNLQEYRGGSNPTDKNSTPTGWSVPLEIEFDDAPYTTLIYGMQEGATDNFDPGIDEPAPPPAPDGRDAYFSSISGEGGIYARLLKDKRELTTVLTTWRLVVKVPPGKGGLITWNPHRLPQGVPLTWQEADANWEGVSNTYNLRETAWIDIPVNETGNLLTRRYLFRASPTSLFTLPLEAGWNLISLPLNPLITNPQQLFGDRLIAIWRWDREAQRYLSPTQIKAKEGYWVAVSERVSVEIEGVAPETTSVPLLPGWNLVGPVGNQPSPMGRYPFVIAVFGWDWPPHSRYLTPESCEEGKGYWVAATQEGKIW